MDRWVGESVTRDWGCQEIETLGDTETGKVLLGTVEGEVVLVGISED